jgi:hypothetical protein
MNSLNLYGEYNNKFSPTNKEEEDSIVYIDSDSDSLMNAILKVRHETKQVVDTTRVVDVYIVSGDAPSILNFDEFIKYLHSVSSSENIKFRIIFRGVFSILHLPIVVSDFDVMIGDNSIFRYDKKFTHTLLKYLIPKKESMNKFISYFIQNLSETSQIDLDIDFLNKIELKFTKF